MKKREWIYILLPLFLVWFVDASTKQWAIGLTKIISFKYVHFVVSHNHGAFLGLFSNLPPLLRVVTLSTFGAFLVFAFAMLQYILPIRSMKLRIGSAILIGGIIGNVFDRIRWGYVVDFLIIGKEKVFMSPPFNLADALQWVGYILICVAVFRDGNLLWPTENSRKNIWIDPKFQYRYIWLLIIMTTSISLIAGVFAFTFLRVTIIELIGKNNYILSKFMIPFIGTYIVITLSFCLLLILVGRILSHRTAGPIYAFQKYIFGLLKGEDRQFKLRTSDDFKQLEALAKKIKENLNIPIKIVIDDNLDNKSDNSLLEKIEEAPSLKLVPTLEKDENEPPDISTLDELEKIDSDLNKLIKKGS